MKKMLSVAGVFLTVLAGLAISSPANATATSATHNTVAATAASTSVAPNAVPASTFKPMTGNYYYVCVLTTGNSWTLASGEPTTDCKGSYLQQYLDGNQTHIWSLAYNGQPVRTATLTGWCILGLAGAMGLVYFPPTDAAAWAYGSTIAAGGLASCFA